MQPWETRCLIIMLTSEHVPLKFLFNSLKLKELVICWFWLFWGGLYFCFFFFSAKKKVGLIKILPSSPNLFFVHSPTSYEVQTLQKF